MIETAKKFSENPDGVLVFTFNSTVEKLETKDDEKKKKKRSDDSENIALMRRNIEVFSHEKFFFQEIVDYFKSDFYASRAGECFSLFKIGRYHQIVYMGVCNPELEENEEKRCDAMAEVLRYKMLEGFRNEISSVFSRIKGCKRLEIDLTDSGSLASHFQCSEKELVSALCDALYFAKYSFKKYKKDKHRETIEEIVLINGEAGQRIQRIIEERRLVCTAVMEARDLINEPPNRLGVEDFNTLAKNKAKKCGFSHSALSARQLKTAGLNGLLAVNAGSAEEAKLVLLEYAPQKATRTVLLVGKGVLFDSGGISLKQSKAMAEMKMDMSGAAVVFSAISAIAQLRLPVRVVAAMPLTDNMPSSKALRVGDVISMYGGKSVEVLNTDAEGRLILADTLGYCIEKYHPNHTIDLATLTGAVMSALGNQYAGIFSNDRDLSVRLQRAGQRVGEKLWPLPIDHAYEKQLDSVVADLSNIGGPYGGAITAAKFLHSFVGKNSWSHIDIAGVMSSSSKRGYYSRGGVGFGVRMLVDFVAELSNQKQQK